MENPFDKNKIFTVTEISSAIKTMLEGVFSPVAVEGEISNLKTSAAGHVYFDLKDENALISAVLFRGRSRALALKEGARATVRGALSCYIKQGRYQIAAQSVEINETGNLFLEFEKLKAKLAAEGLFDQDRKKDIPKFPARIGVITSPTGAALRDILSVLRRRASSLEIIIAPVLVQGEGSKEQIAKAIQDLNRLKPAVDVILMGRGGGSIEDLWSFNEELVVREIAKSAVPIISCVGHETDFTLADFAADLRAPTPSAAAELVAENAHDTKKHIARLSRLLAQSLDLIYERLSARLKLACERKFFKRPALLFFTKEQLLDDISEKLYLAFDKKFTALSEQAKTAQKQLALLNPKATLKRGYAIVRRTSDGAIVLSSLTGERLKIETSQDVFEAETI